MDYKKYVQDLINIDGVDKAEVDALVQPAKDTALADYCLPCFKFAKLMRKAPLAIAEEIAQTISKDELIESVEAVAGYVNFKLSKAAFAKTVVDDAFAKGEGYGASNEGDGKTICIDYSSINIAKPFHMGHLSTTAIGASLYKIYNKLGYRVVGINHLGDWGTQFGKLIVAFKKWGNKADIEARGVRGLLDIYVKFHKEAEKDESLNDDARRWFKLIEDGNQEATELFLWFKDLTLKEISRTYDRLHVKFDSYAGESFYNDKMQPVLDEIAAKGLSESSEGATVVKFPNDEMPPCLLIKADGATLYATRDLAAAFYRKKTYDFYKSLYVVAYQQNLHFKQLFKVIDMMGYDWAKDMEHVAFGMVSMEDGKLSTRDGNVVFVEDVLDKARDKALEIINAKSPDLENKEQVAEMVGTGAVIFGVLSNNRIKDIVFSYDKVLNFDGETGPYVQYTYARCCSLLKKIGEIGENCDYNTLKKDDAYELIKLIEKYPAVLKEAGKRYEPSLVTRHLLAIASQFNKFYIEQNIMNSEESERNARLKVVKITRDILRSGMALLGIDCPEQM